MATKNKNQRRKVELYLMAVTSCIVLAGVWAVLVTPETSLAKGKPVGDGGGGNDSVCIEFDDALGDGVQSDGLGDYCNDKKKLTEALMDGHGHVELRTNSGKDPDGGRSLFVDLGRVIELIGKSVFDPDFNLSIQTTDDLPEDISHSGALVVGGIDLRAMEVGGPSDEATLQIRIPLRYPDETKGTLRIHYDPGYDRFGCTSLDSTTVDVTCVDTGIWEVHVDAVEDKAALIEAYKDGTRANIPWDVHCRTPLPVPEGAEDMLALPSFAFVIRLAP
jgi:hypothetical protein